MQPYTVLPDKEIQTTAPVSKKFKDLGIDTFQKACRFVHKLPYGYNSDRDDLLILFEEQMGTCTTKHAVIVTLAEELDLPVAKHIGIYAMDEKMVSGTQLILDTYHLPYIPMVHCFLVSNGNRVDLTEGNHNGKNRPINHFLWFKKVSAAITSKKEYQLYREVLTDKIMGRPEFDGLPLKTVLQAREKGLILLRSHVA